MLNVLFEASDNKFYIATLALLGNKYSISWNILGCVEIWKNLKGSTEGKGEFLGFADFIFFPIRPNFLRKYVT